MSGLNLVTIPEGLTASEIGLLLSNHLGVPVAAFDSLAHDRAFLDTLGIDAPSIEGYLAPDTYEFLPGTTPDVAYRTMASRTQRILLEAAAGRDSLPLGLTLRQILTMASIVESEAQVAEGAAEDRARLPEPSGERDASPGRPDVCLRARQGAALAIAAAPAHHRLAVQHLPVRRTAAGPICNPGRASIESVINPADGIDALYFVARGQGRHAFSKTYEEHLENIRRVRATAAAEAENSAPPGVPADSIARSAGAEH
jgi:UPF0755 protein